MNDGTKNLKTDSLFFGVILIGAGVMLLLHQLHMAEIGRLVRYWWPLLIVFMGAGRIMNREGFWGGLWLMTVGSWLQIVTLRLFGLTFRNSWPLLLIAIGAGSVVRALVEVFQSRKVSEGSHERH